MLLHEVLHVRAQRDRGGLTVGMTGLFVMVMDRQKDEVRQESLFEDGIGICSESREQVEKRLEMWKYALESRGMWMTLNKPLKINRQHTIEVKKRV